MIYLEVNSKEAVSTPIPRQKSYRCCHKFNSCCRLQKLKKIVGVEVEKLFAQPNTQLYESSRRELFRIMTIFKALLR